MVRASVSALIGNFGGRLPSDGAGGVLSHWRSSSPVGAKGWVHQRVVLVQPVLGLLIRAGSMPSKSMGTKVAARSAKIRRTRLHRPTRKAVRFPCDAVATSMYTPGTSVRPCRVAHSGIVPRAQRQRMPLGASCAQHKAHAVAVPQRYQCPNPTQDRGPMSRLMPLQPRKTRALQLSMPRKPRRGEMHARSGDGPHTKARVTSKVLGYWRRSPPEESFAGFRHSPARWRNSASSRRLVRRRRWWRSSVR